MDAILRPSPVAPEIPSIREALALFLRLFGLTRPYWLSMARGLALGVGIGLVGVVSPYLTKLLIDEVYPTRNVNLMHAIVGAVLAVTVASGAMGSLRGYYTQVISSRLHSAASLMYFNYVQHLPMRFFEEHRVGEVMSRFQDVRNALGTVSRVFETILLRGIYFVLVPPLLLLFNWKLAIIALLTVPFTTTISMIAGRVLRKWWKQSAEAYAELSAFQVEALSHIRTLKALAMEHRTYENASDQLGRALSLQLKAGGLSSLVGLLNGVVRAGGSALLTWFGWTLILRGELTLGEFIAFTMYQGYLTGPVNQFASLFVGFQQAAVTFGRMFEYLDTPTEQDATLAYRPRLPLHHRVSGQVRLARVSFGYTPEKLVLQDVSFEASCGSITAIVGPSGAGKSSLLRLLCRMDEPRSGRILVDGVPLPQIPLSDLRRQVSVVWQEVALVRGTLWENLTLGVETPDRGEVEQAVRACQLEDLISDLPGGYEAPIAEWGATLSGGQRQRVAIARALVRRTPLVLLDEATSNIDVSTEMELLRQLFARLCGRTVFFVSHRLATAALADRICMLDGGRVVGIGTHQELLTCCEPYRATHQLSVARAEDMRRLRVLGQSP